MYAERDIAILMEDGCTKEEAANHLRNGTIIYDAEEYAEHFDLYMKDLEAALLDEEELEKLVSKFKNMVETGKAPIGLDWGDVIYDGKKYFIQYVL